MARGRKGEPGSARVGTGEASDRRTRGDEGTVQPTLVGGGSSDRRLVVLVVLILAFLGVAIVKPWGAAPGELLQTFAPVATNRVVPRDSIATTAPEAPSPETTSPETTASPEPLPVAFTIDGAPDPVASWTGLRWRRLAGDDPLGLVRSVVPWGRGYVAVGRVTSSPATPVWISADGGRFEPVPFNTSTTFWPGTDVLLVAEIGHRLVAVSETMEFCGAPCEPTYVLPVVSWTSADGLTWGAHLLPPEWLASPTGVAPLVATGPAGIVVASRGTSSRVATSADGTAWTLAPASAFPAGFALDDLRGTRGGYVAIGRWRGMDGRSSPAALVSADGRSWPRTPILLPGAGGPAGADLTSTPLRMLDGRDGLVAVESDPADPTAGRWWQSADGRRWRSLEARLPFGSLGSVDTVAGNGNRLLTVRAGQQATAWVSTDGLAWRQLTLSGAVPSVGNAGMEVAVLPGGVLLTDGSSRWFGQAVVGPAP